MGAMKSVAAAAACTVLFGAAPAAAAAAALTATAVYADDGNGPTGGQGQWPSGGGTATPELPSGVLVVVGLIPLAAGAVFIGRRGRKTKTD